MTGRPYVLIVDDEPSICNLLVDNLSTQGCSCLTALNGNDALHRLAGQRFDVDILDIMLPGVSGMELLKFIHSNYPGTVAIMITAVNDLDTAVKAMKLGALDYVVKPFTLERIDSCLRHVLQGKKLGEKAAIQEGCSSQENQSSQKTASYSEQMDAIAYGVEARLDLIDQHSEIVIQRTADVARRFAIPEIEIRRWTEAKTQAIARRDEMLKCSLEKLENQPLAQIMLGLTQTYQCDL